MKITITEQQLIKLVENLISPLNIPNTMTFWHGGNLDDISYDLTAQKSGKYQYGPGLYLITEYMEAIKYSKGNRKLYMVTVQMGTDLEDSSINADTVKEFINTYAMVAKRKTILQALEKRIDPNNNVPASIVNNLLINYDAIKPAYTKYLKQLYMDNGIDYQIVNNPFGWGETMMILYNTRKIVDITRVNPKDTIEKYSLHK